MKVNRVNKKSNIIGKNVKKYRTRCGFTQDELCVKLALHGISLYHSDIYLIEHNKRVVRDYELLALAKVFNASLYDLYDDIDEADIIEEDLG